MNRWSREHKIVRSGSPVGSESHSTQETIRNRPAKVSARFGLTLTAVALLLYGIFAADADGFGFQQYLGEQFGSYKLITRGAYLLLFLVALLILMRPTRSARDARIRKMTLLPILLSGWIVGVCLVKGYDLPGSLSFLVYSGLPAYVIWVSVARHERFRTYFMVFVFFQIALAVAIIIFPVFHGIDGATYQLRGTGIPQSTSVNLFLPTGTTSKGSVQRYAQFHNPNVLGFYGCVALACGYSLAWRPGLRSKIAAVSFFALGMLAWLNSLTRGPMLALLFGIVLSFFVARGRILIKAQVQTTHTAEGRRTFRLRSPLVISAALFCLLALMLVSNKVFSFLIPSQNNISVTGRLPGYAHGFEAIARYPILGVDKAWDWTGGYPHFLPLLTAGLFGVVAGLAILVICFWVGAKIAVRALRIAWVEGRLESRNTLALLLVLVALAIASTNNLTAPVLFWLCLAEATLVTNSNEKLVDATTPRAPASR